MNNALKVVKEVRSNHTDDQNYRHIDVWFSENEGQTIAIVCEDTKKVFFIDSTFLQDSIILNEISEVLKSLE